MATIVVSDTSPVRALHHLGLLPLLERIYGTVYVPHAVADELRAPSRRFPPVDSSSFPFFVVESPKDLIRVEQLEKQLDRGEAAAIALAIEKNADRLLIDEHDGRMMAESLGLSVVGVLGFLLEAKKQSLVPAVCPLIERLQKEIGFHLSPRLVARVIQLAGE